MNMNDRATLRRWIACAEDLDGYLSEDLEAWRFGFGSYESKLNIQRKRIRLGRFIDACSARLREMDGKA